MVRRWSWILGIGLGLGMLPVAFTSVADAAEQKEHRSAEAQPKTQHEKVKLEQVPEPARAAIMREAEGGKIDRIELQTRGTQSVYDVKIHPKGGGPQLELQVNTEGQVVSRHSTGEKKD